MKPRILVVEDQSIVMEQVCDFLEWIGCEVVGKANDGSSAVERYSELLPDLVTMDLIMPSMNGAEATGAILEKHPGAKVLVFTSLDVDGGGIEDGLVRKALGNGAIGAVCKFSKTGIATEMKRLFGPSLDI